jgi:hypothetical protein
MSHIVPLLKDPQLWQRCQEEIQRCVRRLCDLLPQAMDVLERHVQERYAPTAHRAARSILSLAGVARLATQLVPPAKPQTQPPQDATEPKATETSAPPAPAPSLTHENVAKIASTLPRSTVQAMHKAISAIDQLGLHPRTT